VLELRLTPSKTVAQTVQQPQAKSRAAILRDKIVLTMLIVIGSLIAAAFIGWNIAVRLLEIRAFRTPSNSMCPAICIDEHFFASMNAYRRTPPQRGDVILHLAAGGALFSKRVVGLAGDTIAPGAHNEVLVNGKPLPQVSVCGKPQNETHQSDGPSFDVVKVPDGKLFVLGDNVSNSYDSRFYGPITIDQVRGKPLFIYWSPGSARVGCRIGSLQPPIPKSPLTTPSQSLLLPEAQAGPSANPPKTTEATPTMSTTRQMAACAT